MCSSNFVYLFLLCFLEILCVFVKQSTSTAMKYEVEFEILEYYNKEGRLLSGDCCSGYKSTLGHGLCRGGNSSCSPFWKICLTHQPNEIEKNGTLMMPTQRRNDVYLRQKDQEKPSLIKSFFNRIFGSIKIVPTIADLVGDNKKPGHEGTQNDEQISSCSVAFWSTDVIRNIKNGSPLRLKASIPSLMTKRIYLSQLPNLWRTENNSLESFLNPIVQQKVLVFVEIWHQEAEDSENTDKLIARHLEQRNTSVYFDRANTKWEFGGTDPTNSNASRVGIHFKYRWRITAVSPDQPQTTTEEPICPEGWSGSSCNKPICMKGCHPTRGFCEKPDDCKCKFGWTGELCDMCVPMPGCVHGICSKPFECRCENGWNGMFCDKPSCTPGCHHEQGYCEHPEECRCRFGFEGDNCTECATMPGCQNGGCDNPLDCNCFEGWKGLFCSIPLCSSGCDLNHGWCRRPNECRCRVGWSGENCTECVPYPGCDHGNCTTPWTCDCEPGWGGITCSEKLDWCENNPNPCSNGGTCISVEEAEGFYLCQCPLGYEGKRCERLKK